MECSAEYPEVPSPVRGWDRVKAEERQVVLQAGFPAELEAGPARDWDRPASVRGCSGLDCSLQAPE